MAEVNLGAQHRACRIGDAPLHRRPVRMARRIHRHPRRVHLVADRAQRWQQRRRGVESIAEGRMQRGARARCSLASGKAPVRQQQSDDVGAEVEQRRSHAKLDDGANCSGLGQRGRLATAVDGGELQDAVDGHPHGEESREARALLAMFLKGHKEQNSEKVIVIKKKPQ